MANDPEERDEPEEPDELDAAQRDGLGDMDPDGIVGPRDITLLIERWGQ